MTSCSNSTVLIVNSAALSSVPTPTGHSRSTMTARTGSGSMCTRAFTESNLDRGCVLVNHDKACRDLSRPPTLLPCGAQEGCVQRTVDGTSRPSIDEVVRGLPTERILDLCRVFGCEVREGARDRVMATLVARLRVDADDGRLRDVLDELGRDELRAACRRFGLDASARARADLRNAILVAAGVDPRPAAGARSTVDGLPSRGQVVQARRRQWLVEEVTLGEPGESALVRLVCLDDDDPGRVVDVLWDLELGARVVEPERQGLGAIARLDPPTHFGAYLHALKWSAVSAADATRFQAPFRAGIKLMAHQLTPLMKALELPRANLFIADDVGLGKTIEAGLVLQELILRQQAGFVLIVAPSSVCAQWQGEMMRRFGLRFEVMTRQFVAYRRQERGLATNPWTTYHRFIISHALLRRPEYRGQLFDMLGDRVRKGLIILDEAHNAAPATASKYAVDTALTETIRELAPKFDNRLFLSATPHNGHSNSFSALLEILDPVRFTRGVPVDGKRELEPIMVRRLKRDLRKLGVETFPRRMLCQLSLSHRDGAWFVDETAYDAETGQQRTVRGTSLGSAPPYEIDLAKKLARYTELCAPASGQGRVPFIRLQQRLLSSPEAFARTLDAHVEGLGDTGPRTAPQQRSLIREDVDPDLHGEADEIVEEEEHAEVARKSAGLSPPEEARALLSDMRALAARARTTADAKVLALLAWMREHLCPAIGAADTRDTSWTRRRVIIFTEWADTKRYVLELLTRACEDTDRGDQRILQFHGGMGDDARAEVQRAFNADPDEHPARILVATDAAREGVNLQAHCADLFHLDIPWNPSRLEQRNGRIDRTLQPAEEVRCHYFVYAERDEDRILDTVVRKVETVQRELGSLGAVVLEQIERALDAGINKTSASALERADDRARLSTVNAELEGRELDALRAEVDRASRRLDSSRRALEVEPESLRGVVDVGLAFARADPLRPAAPTNDGRPAFTLPALDRSWNVTLDTLRPPRAREETFWDFRNKPPRAVTFHPLSRLNEDAEQLHLAHPFVKRILDRFLAQGFGAHDLSRVTAVVAPDESVIRVVAFARLTLFGASAARLHDQLVPMAAAWSGNAGGVEPYKDRATFVKAVALAERLLARDAKAPNTTISRRIVDHAPALFAALWPHLEAEADALGAEAKTGLGQRARKESDDLRALLHRQRGAIQKADERLRQREMFELQDRDQRRQVERDLAHLDKRRGSLAAELENEPRAIEALYEVRMTRLSPVGLVVIWPEAMT